MRRGVRSNAFYCVDTVTGKRTSLRTGDEEEARQIVEAIRPLRVTDEPGALVLRQPLADVLADILAHILGHAFGGAANWQEFRSAKAIHWSRRPPEPPLVPQVVTGAAVVPALDGFKVKPRADVLTSRW